MFALHEVTMSHVLNERRRQYIDRFIVKVPMRDNNQT